MIRYAVVHFTNTKELKIFIRPAFVGEKSGEFYRKGRIKRVDVFDSLAGAKAFVMGIEEARS